MAKNSTSFTKHTAPKGKGAAKHIKTRIKEAIGLDSWQNLCEFVKADGAKKLKDEMNKLKGKDYVIAYTTLLEFVKPKLQRVSHDGESQTITININGKKVN